MFSTPTDYLSPRVDEAGVGSVIPKTCLEVFWATVVKHGNRPAMALKRKIGGKIADDWEIMTWNEYWTEARTFAKALHSVKVNKFDIVNIMGFNSPQVSQTVSTLKRSTICQDTVSLI